MNATYMQWRAQRIVHGQESEVAFKRRDVRLDLMVEQRRKSSETRCGEAMPGNHGLTPARLAQRIAMSSNLTDMDLC